MKKLILLFALFGIILNSAAQDKKISELSLASTTVGDSSLYIIVQSSTTKKQYFIDLQRGVWEGIDNYTNNAGAGENIFWGYQTGKNYAAGDNNIGIGSNAVSYPNGAYNNICIGEYAGQLITSGDENITIGHLTGVNISTGSNNTLLGNRAGFTSEALSNNTFIGAFSGYAENTNGNLVYIGYESGYTGNGAANNTATGYQSLYTNATGASNSAFGYKSLYACTGGNNTTVGSGSGEDATSANYIVAIGVNALANNTTADYNTAVGASALVTTTIGSNNTALGYRAGYSGNVTGCVYLGNEAGYNNATDFVLFIDNSSDATPLIWGDFAADSVIINGDLRATGYAGGATAWTNESDSTMKKNITTIDNALAKVLRLRGVEFEWKDSREPGKRIGFLAQEAKGVVPEVVSGEEGSMSLQYAPVVALLTQAIQEQQKQIRWLYIFCGALSLLSIILLALFVIGKNE